MKHGLLKIDNIMYRVSDLKKAEKFYVGVMGLKKGWQDEEAGMVGFILRESDSEIVVHNNPTMPKFDYAYLIDDVKKFVEEYTKQGYKIELEPIEVRCGRYAVLLDPDGNKIPIIDLTKFGGKPKYD